jgi:hypothetical protein
VYTTGQELEVLLTPRVEGRATLSSEPCRAEGFQGQISPALNDKL